MNKRLLAYAVLLFSLVHCKDPRAELIESKQKQEFWRGNTCTIESPDYRGMCTVLTRTVGNDSTNLHFYLDSQRLISFIIQNNLYQQEVSSDGLSAVSHFSYVWDKDKRVLPVSGICKESSQGAECVSDDASIMVSISR